MLISHSNNRVTPICERVADSDTSFLDNQIMSTQTLTPVNIDRNSTSSTLLHGESYYTLNQPLSHIFAIQQHCTPRGFSLPSHSSFFDMDYIIRLHTATYESVNDIILSNFISTQRSTAGTVNTDPIIPTNSTFAVNTTTHPNTSSLSIQSAYSPGNVNTGFASLPAVRSWPPVRPTQRQTRLFSSNQRPSNSLRPHDRRTTSSSILQTILSFLGLSNLISTLPRPASFEFEPRRNTDVLRPIEYHEMQGVPRHLLQMLPAETFRFSSNESSLVGVCPVCHLDYVNYDRRKRLPCLHHFHAECIDKWLTTRRSCPVCRLCVMATLRQTDALLYNDGRGDQFIGETRDTNVPRAPDPISSDLMNTLSENTLSTTTQTNCIEVPPSSSSSTVTNDMSRTPLHEKESREYRTGQLQEIPLIKSQKKMRFGPPIAVDVISLDSSVLLVKDNSPTKKVPDASLFQHHRNAQNTFSFNEKSLNAKFSSNSSRANGSGASGSSASGTIAIGSGASNSSASGSIAIGSVASGSSAIGSGASGSVARGSVASNSVASGSSAIGSGASGSVARGSVASGSSAIGSGASGSVARGSVARGSVASGSVASGSVASGSVASGSVASGSVASGSGASGSVASGSVASGSVASGSVASGSSAIGSGASGSSAIGSGASGSVARGSVASGSSAIGSGARGSVARGSVARGSVARGSVARGSVASGSVASGSSAIGSGASGSGASGSVASGSVASGSVASGSSAIGSGASGSGASGSVGMSGTRRGARVRFKVLEDKVDTKIIEEEEIHLCLNTNEKSKETHEEQVGFPVLSEDVYTKTPRLFYTRPTCFILNPSSRCSFILNDGLTTDACHTSNF